MLDNKLTTMQPNFYSVLCAEICAALCVVLFGPLKLFYRADVYEITFPFVFGIEIIVLLKVD